MRIGEYGKLTEIETSSGQLPGKQKEKRILMLCKRMRGCLRAQSCREKVCVGILACFFAVWMVLGYSFAKTDSWRLVFGSWQRIVVSGVVWLVLCLLFYMSISLFFLWLDKRSVTAKDVVPPAKKPGRRGLWKRYQQLFLTHPFLTPFLTLLLVYLPILFFSYPGVFMGDDVCMILQGYNFPDPTSRYLNLIDENMHLNGHHPVVYTMFLHLCLKIGTRLFSSYTAGILLVSISQLLVTAAVLAGICCVLIRRKVRPAIVIGVMAYYIISPRTQNYMFLLSKDVFFAAALLGFVATAWMLFTQGMQNADKQARGADKSAGRRGHMPPICVWGMFVISGIAVGLLRNDGKYVLLGTFFVLVLAAAKQRRQFLSAGVLVLGTLVLYGSVLMPALHITPSGKREMLSVPFQQTARYLRDAPEDVTAEEYAAVSAILDAENLAEKYNPEKSDPVKNTFRETASKEELRAYFQAWLSMLRKHPEIYFQATINNYYNYFYPCGDMAGYYSYAWSDKSLKKCVKSKYLSTIDFDVHIPDAVREWRTIYELVRELVFSLPVLSVFKIAALYVWALLLLAVYLFARKEYRLLALTMPYVLCLCTALLGPCNGNYFRYLYGTAVALPVLWIVSMHTRKAD